MQNRNGPGLVWEGVEVIPEEPAVAYQGAADPAADFDSFVDASSPRLIRAAVLLTGDYGRAEDHVQIHNGVTAYVIFGPSDVLAG